MADKSPSLTLPDLPGQYRWQRSDRGARIFLDYRAERFGRAGRRNIGHFPEKVLRHVLLGERLEGEPWLKRARRLESLLRRWRVSFPLAKS